MSERKRVETGAPWEAKVGYSRATRLGPIVSVSGTVALGEDGRITAPGDPYAQARRILEIIEQSLNELGATFDDVYRTRMYVTDIEAHWEPVGRAHAEAFGNIRPATSMVQAHLIDPTALVEIEADAYVSE